MADTGTGEVRVSHRPFDDCMIGDRAAAVISRVALWGGSLAVVALVVYAWVYGIPSPGEAWYWQTTAQIVLLVVYAVASVTARWRPMSSATVMTVAAFAIGALANVELRPLSGLVLALGLWLPAGLHWLVWQRTKPVIDVVGLAAILLVCVAAAGWAGNFIWTFYQGPQTEQSQREPFPQTGVRWVWAGAVTTSSFDVVARLDEVGGQARLRYGTSPDLSGDVSVTDVVAADPQTNGVRFNVDGLEPGMQYYYAVQTDDVVDLSRQGTVTTFSETVDSVTVAFGSGARGGSNSEVFETIRELGPDLFIMTGDLHYEDFAENRISDFVRGYDKQLTPGAPQALYLSTPVVYVWDDHDFGPNDADGTSRSRPAALASYRSLVPHYPLALEGDDTPIAQAFTVGKFRFIVTDLRSSRDPMTEPDDPAISMMGQPQLAWFEQELVESARTHALVVWVSSVPWIATTAPGDSWGAYTVERAAIADLVAGEGIDNLVMLASDAHMVAADDGTNNTFSSAGEASFPVLQGAALDRQGSVKGGPYSEGAFGGSGQFGWVEITDSGDEMSLRFEGRTWDDKVLVDLDADFAVD